MQKGFLFKEHLRTNFNLANLFSTFRAPLSIIFVLYKTPLLRFITILFAIATDIFDGFIARKQKTTSQFGAILDPVMDKLFIGVALLSLFMEKKICISEIALVLMREMSLVIFSIYVLLFSKKYIIKANIFGKIFTAYQFLILGSIILNYPPPFFFYSLFPPIAFFFLLSIFKNNIKEPIQN